MKFLLFLILLPISLHGQYAQNPVFQIPILAMDTNHFSLVSAEYEVGSNSLTRKFYNNLFYNTFITEESKKSVVPYLMSENRAGATSQQEFYYTWKTGKKTRTFNYISVRNRSTYAVGFSADAYNLLLFGNANYGGKTLNLDNFHFKETAFSGLHFGKIWQYKKKGQEKAMLYYGGSIGLLKGTHHTDYYLPTGRLYTSETGDSIHFTAEMEMKQTSPRAPVTTFNGFGISVNPFLKILLSEKVELNFLINDFGILNRPGKKSTIYNFNTSQSFTGEEIKVVNRNLNISNYRFFIDTIYNDYQDGREHKSHTTWLPATLIVGSSIKLNDKNSFHVGFEYITGMMHRPKIECAITSQVASFLSIGLGFNAGGYGKFGLQGFANSDLGKGWNVRLGTYHLEALFSPNAHSQGLFGSISRSFGKF